MQNVIKDVHFFGCHLRKNLRNEQALRGSFLLQVMGMFLSNISFFIIWILFSETIGPVNGWGPLETFGMLSVSIFIYGIGHTLFGSMGNWYDTVPTGAFDSFLTKPKALYLRIISNRFSVSALGDLVQGILGIGIYMYLAHISLLSVFSLALLLIPALTIHVAMLMICNCVIFWLPQAPGLCQALFNIILLPSTQPISLLGGVMRFIYMFVIPALFIAGIPIEAVIKPDANKILLAYAVAGFWLWMSNAILAASVKRYESGNTIG